MVKNLLFKKQKICNFDQLRKKGGIMNLRLSPAVFYRQYGENVILFQTQNKRVLVLNAGSKAILDCFQDWTDEENYINNLRQEYQIGDAQEEVLVSFIRKMVEDGILEEENILSEKKDGAEIWFQNELLPRNQLYSVQFELTFRCNERCRHCYCVTEPQRQELTLAEIKRILDDLYDMNVFEITFTGGDLFVRKDAFEILRYANQKRFLINIFTNGIALSDSDIFALKELNLKSIHFSIYSHIPEKHDAFTQVKGSFAKTTDVIKKCVLIGIPVNIKSCVLDYNMAEIGDILQLAKDLGTTVQVSMAVNAKNDGDLSPTSFRLKKIEDYVAVMKVVNSNMEIHCSNDYKQLRPDSGAICGAGRKSLNINPYGDVYACNSLLMLCGNVREQSVRDIWEKSEVLKQIRSFTFNQIKGCEGCAQLQYCNFCPGSAYTETGDPLRRYEEACILTEAKKLSNHE